ncbi:type II toxin-antitoxin system RelE/ParE family toxin [Treponema sp. R80B11-R83G3]
MKEIKRSDEFIKWIDKLRDSRARFRIYKRIDRLAEGNPGDVEPAGEGISEMRIDYGPGYRVYYKDTGMEIIILLCGGDKRTQQADIANAKKIARRSPPERLGNKTKKIQRIRVRRRTLDKAFYPPLFSRRKAHSQTNARRSRVDQ